jgi:hypothetical protein
MTSTISQLRVALAASLDGINGLHTYARMPDSPPVPPAAVVRPLTGDYNRTLGVTPTTRLEVVVLVQAARIELAQAALDAYLDADASESLFAAIMTDPTLGGKAHTVLVSGWREYGERQIAGTAYLGAAIDVEVYY